MYKNAWIAVRVYLRQYRTLGNTSIDINQLFDMMNDTLTNEEVHADKYREQMRSVNNAKTTSLGN